jgi:iron-sulfur cluster assembly accessory protein
MPAQPAVTLSAQAVSHFDRIAKNKYVIFSVEGGGCAGFQYAWKIADSPEDLHNDDEIIQFEDFNFVVDGASLMFLMGCHVDYVSDITGSHIEINNPLAKAGCGCGVSVNF